MKLKDTHHGEIKDLKDLQKTLNKFKSKDRLPVYLLNPLKDSLVVIDTVTLGYVRKQLDADTEVPTQDQVLTPQEYESVENKNEYEEILIVGKYDPTLY